MNNKEAVKQIKNAVNVLESNQSQYLTLGDIADVIKGEVVIGIKERSGTRYLHLTDLGLYINGGCVCGVAHQSHRDLDIVTDYHITAMLNGGWCNTVHQPNVAVHEVIYIIIEK